ncbi:MAG: TetR/AcrR family transcriptional regulator [Actinomycetales bacterium]|jgi:AcrR family transcriptional regulator
MAKREPKTVAADTAPDAASGPDVRREQMLRAAVQIICERGFSDTRIADVAARAEASPALVIYYFGTKDGLLTEALRWSEDQFYAATEAVLAQLPTAVERLQTLVTATCVPDRAGDSLPDSWGLWFDLWVQAFRHPRVAKDRVAMDQRWRGAIAQIVRVGQASGEFGDVDIEDFAITWGALLDGLSIQVALEDPQVDSSRAVSIAMRMASERLGFDWNGQIS